MQPKKNTQTLQWPDGRTVTLETGLLARQAHGAVVVSSGKAKLLATVVEKKEKEKGSFLPLLVEYREMFSSAGLIPGGFFRREAKQNEYEIIISRLIDRAIRPLFPEEYIHNLRIDVLLISADATVAVDSLAMLAASSALAISHIPFNGPVASVRIGKINNTLVVNPAPKDLSESPVEVVIAGTAENIFMLEGTTAEVSEDELIEVIDFAHTHIKTQCQAQKALTSVAGQVKEVATRALTPEEQEIKAQLEKKLRPAFDKVVAEGHQHKQERVYHFAEAQKTILSDIAPTLLAQHPVLVEECISFIKRAAIRHHLFTTQKRVDARSPDTIRPIDIHVDYLPSAHGSTLFTRGDTQVLATLTIGSTLKAKYLDGVSDQGSRNFFVHYNFPSFSTGEVKPSRGPGRREIGHSNLVYNALKRLIPVSPCALRLTADTLSSDGSSSMASVCSGTLALMDAGVALPRHVAGIANGIVIDYDTKQQILLSDICSEEDACGDADFKLTGTAKGITACQMDIKTKRGLSISTLRAMLVEARKGLQHILGLMNQALEAPRVVKKPHTPVISQLMINPSSIGAVIGPSGKVIKALQEKTKVNITVEDNGQINFFAPHQLALQEAQAAIENIVGEPELEKVYNGTVKALMQYGVFVEFLPGKQGLLHSEEVEEEQAQDLGGTFKIGDKIKVKLISIIKPKQRNGRTRFSLSVRNLS